MSAFDQSKRGLQDDHDPNDPAQKAADKPHGVKPADKQKPETSPDADTTGGVGSQGGM